MIALLAAVRTGLGGGLVELRNTVTNPSELLNNLVPSVTLIGTVLVLQGTTISGVDVSLAAVSLPGALGIALATNSLLTAAQLISAEREDGTLLRAKAVPHGMVGYLVGKAVQIAGVAAVGFLIILVPGLLTISDVGLAGPGSLGYLVLIALLGLLVGVPIGAIIGSLSASPRTVGLFYPVVMGLVAVSGIFYPLDRFPAWLRDLAQVSPIYWLGLGMRAALLSDHLRSAEIDDSWRSLPTVAVLAGWAGLALALAPVVLRRMARRESGSAVAARREKALQRAS